MKGCVSFPSPSWGGWRIVSAANDVTGGGRLAQSGCSRTAVRSPHPGLRFACPADGWVTKRTGRMGDTCSWFDLVRRGAGAATQLTCFLVDDADRHVEEAHLPGSVLGFLDGDSFTNESAANVDEVASPFDLAVGPDLAHRRFGRVIRLRKSRWHGTGRRLVDACRGRWPSDSCGR